MSRVPNSVLTILASDPAIARWYRDAVLKGQFSPDPAIVLALFRSLDRKRRIDLATSFCGSSLDTQNFVKQR